MKIGVITFHWASNYGAVLQTYSLVNYLKKEVGADVKVIDYCPKNQEISLFNSVKVRKPQIIAQKLKELRREKKIKSFRKKLPLTKRYYLNQQLKEEPLDLDYVLTGSDQIWNPSFLMWGERGKAPTYYLDFVDGNTKRLSVSASFGCHFLPEECQNIAKPLLEKFEGISVRENTGIEILSSMGINDATVTADPTSLITREDLMELCGVEDSYAKNRVSTFILREQEDKTKELISSICSVLSDEKPVDIDYLSMEDWLAAIRDSRFVVTNSFHCVMMCLKLHTPFCVILENGKRSGMNDRFTTLFNKLNLTERMITSTDDIQTIKKEIDFDSVDIQLLEYSTSLKSFLERNLK